MRFHKKKKYHVWTFAFYEAPTSAPKQVMYYNEQNSGKSIYLSILVTEHNGMVAIKLNHSYCLLTWQVRNTNSCFGLGQAIHNLHANTTVQFLNTPTYITVPGHLVYITHYIFFFLANRTPFFSFFRVHLITRQAGIKTCRRQPHSKVRILA